MHPIIARLHPGYRAALGAWILSRLLLWGFAARGASVVETMGAMLEGSQTTPVVGLMLAGWALVMDGLATVRPGGAATFGLTLAPVIVAEILLFFAAVSVYGFARRDQVPHVAERATWLWALCPLMLFTVEDLSWSLGIGLGTIALGAAASGRHSLAFATAALAMGARIEFALLWPALAAMGWTSFHPGRHESWARWLTSVGPLAAFAGWIVFATGMAGRAGVSLRSLHTDGAWRRDFAFRGLEAHAPEFILVGVALLVVALALKFWGKYPRHWLLAVVPLLLWPFLQEPPTAAIAILLWALPSFVHLGQGTENPSLERPVMVAFVLGLMWLH